ncbi:MAG: hypothetical protein KC502_20055 [Myxococcales bacterium]|nr:hypothetical protein [Myxococcales bacterium]
MSDTQPHRTQPAWVAFSSYVRWHNRLLAAIPPGTTSDDLAQLAVTSDAYKALVYSLGLFVEPTWLYQVGYRYGAQHRPAL